MFSKNKKEKKFTKFNYLFKVIFVFLVIIGLYIIFNFVKIFNKKYVKVYEVTIGEIVNVDRHKGFIFREEDVAKCNTDGYINFYVSNTDRVGRGEFIYTINDYPSVFDEFELTEVDKNKIKQNIKKYFSNITDLNFSNIYSYSQNFNNMFVELNILKQLEKIDIEKEIQAKEKGYSKFAGLVSFVIDGFENLKIEDFNSNLFKVFDSIKVLSQKKEVKTGDSIYKIVKDPEFSIAFDSDYDYDLYNKSNVVNVKFIYDNLTTKGHIESFYGNDNKKHFKLRVIEFPEKFIDKRIIDFEIENKKITGYKIPIKSLVTKNCYVVPKNLLEIDMATNESSFYKLGPNGVKIKIDCNISKEDDKYYYISIDDALSKLKYGDVLTNRYNDTYSLNEVKELNGVYNMNKGYAVFKNVDVIDRTNEYAIINKITSSGINLYDHIALDAKSINEGDLIS